MRESTFTLVNWGFIPSFPTKGQLEKTGEFSSFCRICQVYRFSSIVDLRNLLRKRCLRLSHCSHRNHRGKPLLRVGPESSKRKIFPKLLLRNFQRLTLPWTNIARKKKGTSYKRENHLRKPFRLESGCYAKIYSKRTGYQHPPAFKSAAWKSAKKCGRGSCRVALGASKGGASSLSYKGDSGGGLWPLKIFKYPIPKISTILK